MGMMKEIDIIMKESGITFEEAISRIKREE